MIKAIKYSKFLIFIISLLVVVFPVVSIASDTLYEYYHEASPSGNDGSYGQYWKAQTFTAESTHNISSFKLECKRNANPTTLYYELRSTDNGSPTGTALISGSMDISAESTSYHWTEMVFDDIYELTDDTVYALVWNTKDDVYDNMWVCYQNYPGGYADGAKYTSSDSGVSWSAGDEDWLFEVWYSEATATPPLVGSMIFPEFLILILAIVFICVGMYKIAPWLSKLISNFYSQWRY